MTEPIAALHGHVTRVVDVNSQGTTYLRVEIPVEHHVEAISGTAGTVNLALPGLTANSELSGGCGMTN